MLRKTPYTTPLIVRLKRYFKFAIAGELVFLAGTYYVFRRMNTSSDFRFYMHKKCPFILEVFYSVGEQVGGDTTRQDDYRIWGIEK